MFLRRLFSKANPQETVTQNFHGTLYGLETENQRTVMFQESVLRFIQIEGSRPFLTHLRITGQESGQTLELPLSRALRIGEITTRTNQIGVIWTAPGESTKLLVLTEFPDKIEEFRFLVCTALVEEKHTQAFSGTDRDLLRVLPQTDIHSHMKRRPIYSPVKTPIRFVPVVPDRNLTSVDGVLKIWDQTSNEFVVRSELCTATFVEKERFDHYLTITEGEATLFDAAVRTEMQMGFSEENTTARWILKYNSYTTLWTLQLNASDFARFREVFAKCLYERNQQKPWKRAGNTDYLLAEFQEPDLGSDMEYSEDEDIAMFDDFDPEDYSVGEDEDVESQLTGDYNKHLQVGKATDRCFVVRGNQVGVFQAEEDSIIHKHTLSGVTDMAGNKFTPSEVMLHQRDTSFLMLHPDRNNKIYEMDVEKGSVVSEWTSHEDVPVNSIFPLTKLAQTTGQSMFAGINQSSLFLMDPRVSEENKIVQDQMFTYARTTKAQLSCACTTQSGFIATGSESGEIRLYSSFDKRAKTILPGFGDPIIGIDATADASWVLATCEQYILVSRTELDDGRTGFEVRMGKKKPIPIRLKLKRDHLIRIGGTLKFTPAHFNVSETGERSIVTSSGAYLITWNFSKVKRGITDEYQILKYQDVVVRDQFVHGGDNAVVVALPNDVTLAKRKRK